MILISIGIFIYWTIGIFIFIQDWTNKFDLLIVDIFLIVFIFWIVWPLVLLEKCAFVVIRKKRKEN